MSANYDHRVNRMAEADRDLSVYLVQPLLEQDTQSRMPRPHPGSFARPHNISGQSVPELHTCRALTCFPGVQVEPPVSHFEPNASCLALGTTDRSLALFSLPSPFIYV